MTHSDKDNQCTYPDIQRSGGDVATKLEFEPYRQKSAVARSRNLPHVMNVYFDSLTSFYFLFPSVENLSPS